MFLGQGDLCSRAATPKKRPKIGPDDASDMKSSRLTSPTNPKLEDLISFRL
jgi:hypothetical protein